MEENREPGMEEGREGADTGVYAVDAIAGMFSDGDGEAADEGGAAEEDNREHDAGAADAGAADAGSGDTSGADGEKAEASPDVPMPEGWEEAVWQGLSPNVRSAIHAREQAHAQALSHMQAEQQAVRQQQEQFAVAANAQIQQALAAMKQIVEGEYGGVDWNGLARSDPAAYVRLQQAYAARVQAIQRIQQSVAQQVRAYESARAQEARKALEAEFAQVQPEIRALIGAGFNGKTFAADMAKYMAEQGCPEQAINGLSKGYELRLVAKAMLHDDMMSRRAAAAKKVAEAPRVQTPRGSHAGDTGRAARARALLNNHPNSTDALAALFEAM